MHNLAIIPARGGSKRIPGKNIRDFLGKPIIAYSIEKALECGLFDKVMVSTDDKEIAAVARKYHAEIPFFRSKETADDHAILQDVIDETLKEYHKNSKNFEYCCCILPTAPFITADLLKKGFELMVNEDFDSVRPIIRFSYPIQRALKLSGNETEMFHPELYVTRSQDLPPAYYDAGMFYWMKTKTGIRYGRKGAIVIPELSAHDIDTEEDWAVAEWKFRYLEKRQKRSE